jgi:hypothetical protein
MIDAPDGAAGFRLGETLHPWGTSFEQVAPGVVDEGYASHELPCSTAYGFETIYAEVTAARPDRPIITVAYELAGTITPKEAFARLVIALGQPDSVDREGETEGAGSPDSVVLYATWERGPVSWGLSLYGAPRPSDFGDGIGKLYLSWADMDTAAAPFVAAWRAANEALARAADAAAPPAIFTVAWPIFDPADDIDEESTRALNRPDLLATPQPVAARLGASSFALWQSGGKWHLSHGRDSVVLGNAPVQFHHIEPARGGGYAAIEVGSWLVRDEFGSRAIADAEAALARLPGLVVELHQGTDV